MKKWMKCLIFALMATGLMTGCGTGTEPALKDDDRIKIVTTVFPEYDWVRAILGEFAENTELTLLLDNKVDLHSFQPTADDIVKISTCDLFVYVGGESDEWVEAALKEASNPDMVVVNLLDILGDMVKEEEIAEGMQTEEHEHEHEEGEEEAYDEHVWLSLKNAKHICQILAEQLEKIDPENAESYQSNASAYIDQLNSLDAKYQDAVQQSDKKVVLFGDRFPFRYLTDDYDLDYYAAFSGCSAETEASFETIVFLANKMDELSLNNILVIDGSDQKIADTILSNTKYKKKDQKILSMDSMQSTTLGDVEHGVTYLSVMEKNLEALKQALE